VRPSKRILLLSYKTIMFSKSVSKGQRQCSTVVAILLYSFSIYKNRNVVIVVNTLLFRRGFVYRPTRERTPADRPPIRRRSTVEGPCNATSDGSAAEVLGFSLIVIRISLFHFSIAGLVAASFFPSPLSSTRIRDVRPAVIILFPIFPTRVPTLRRRRRCCCLLLMLLVSSDVTSV